MSLLTSSCPPCYRGRKIAQQCSPLIQTEPLRCPIVLIAIRHRNNDSKSELLRALVPARTVDKGSTNSYKQGGQSSRFPCSSPTLLARFPPTFNGRP